MTLRFHDVSHYNPGYHPSGPTIAKATQGLTFVDPTYSTNRDRTVAGGWPFAGYHYLTTEDARAQAAHAYAVVGAGTPLMVDVEQGSGSLAHLLNFIAAYRDMGGLLTLVYLPHWYWDGAWHGPSLTVLTILDVALISSAYPTSGYSDSGIGWQPYGGIAPAIWQYTSTPIDTNAFRGTLDELRALFEGTHATGGATDMNLTDPLDDGKGGTTTVGAALTTILARSANLGPWEKTELDAIEHQGEALATAAAVATLTAKVDTLTAALAKLPVGISGDMAVTGTLHVAPPAS